jgi:pentatricopeptide repeat protein
MSTHLPDLYHAFALLADARQSFTLNCRIYTTLLTGCARNRIPEKGFELFQQMKHDKIAIDEKVICAMMMVCGVHGEVDKAIQLFSELGSHNIVPTARIYRFD